LGGDTPALVVMSFSDSSQDIIFSGRVDDIEKFWGTCFGKIEVRINLR